MSVYNRQTSDPTVYYYQYISKRTDGTKFYYDIDNHIEKEIAQIKANDEKRQIKRKEYTEYQATYYKFRKNKVRECRKRKIYHVNNKTKEILPPRYLRERERKHKIQLEKLRERQDLLSKIILTDKDLWIDFTWFY